VPAYWSMERDGGIGVTYAATVAIEKTAIAKMKKKWPRRLMAKHGGLGDARQFNPGQAGKFRTTGSAQAGRGGRRGRACQTNCLNNTLQCRAFI
jgi:hypothetical protein